MRTAIAILLLGSIGYRSLAMERRTFLKTSAAILATGALQPLPALLASETEQQDFKLPALPFGFTDLEPYIDQATMEIHYNKHHQAYINNLNKEIFINPDLQNVRLSKLLSNISKYSSAVRNNAGGHFNHSLFWQLLAPANRTGKPATTLLAAIEQDFGSLDQLKQALKTSALNCFGSGWGWLVRASDGKLKVGSTPNQDNPLMDIAELRGEPLIAVDVWEHAYYLKYQNRRADYLDSFWSVLNWNVVNKRFLASAGG